MKLQNLQVQNQSPVFGGGEGGKKKPLCLHENEKSGFI
jgi:hypothetical protein